MALPLHPFRPRLLHSLAGYDRRRLIADIGAGLSVGVVALPLAMAFAIASGVPPEAGLVTAIVGGFLISALGGSNVQIGGPAGAFIVVVYGIVERHGLANLLIATMGAGVLLLAMGLLRLGALVRHVPVSIVIGFTNGIAVLVVLSQLKDLLGLPVAKMPADFFAQAATLARHLPLWNPAALALGAASLALVALWPRGAPPRAAPGLLARTRRLAAHVPGTLVALVAATAATAWLQLPVETIASRFGGIPQTLPPLAMPAFDWLAVKQLLGPMLTLAALGAIESLLCARVADQAAPELPRHDPNQELMAQGVANIAAPLWGGLPATGTIARTLTNVRAGARTPVAGMVHATTLLLVMLAAAPLALHVPLAALAGILLFVAWNMGEWREFARLRRFNPTYRSILLATFAATVVFDLTVAVELGLVLACVFFVWRMGQQFCIEAVASPPAPEGVQLLALRGALFFGAVGKLEALAEQVPAGTRALVLDLQRLLLLDSSGADALAQLQRTLQRRGTALVLAGAGAQPLSLIRRSGLAEALGPEGLPATLEAALPAGRTAHPGPLKSAS